MTLKYGIVACILLLPVFVAAGEPVFDQERAFSFLEKQVSFGPRIVGSSGHAVMKEWLSAELVARCDTVISQTYRIMDPMTGTEQEFTNFIGRLQPEVTPRVMLMAHWDTRPIADMDPDPDNRMLPIPGANDGASGVAVLLEILRALDESGRSLPLDLAFWDAEDRGRSGRPQEFCLGSAYYARQPIKPLPSEAILLDMIGDEQLEIFYEGYSLQYAPGPVLELWKIAADLGYGDVFIPRPGTWVYDDHVPLNTIAGIPSLDIIDFDYPGGGVNFWHTMEDTPDKCSPSSLGIVGNVLLVYLMEKY